MAFLGIEFNDSMLIASNGSQLLFAEQGCAALDGGGVVFGAEARATACSRPNSFHNRYWLGLSERQLTRGTADFATFADLAHGQLARLWQACGAGFTDVGYAVPVYWSEDQLALLLGISQELGIPVAGFAAIPVAATRREYRDCELLHLDLSTHVTALSYMQQQGAAAIERSEVFADLGIAAIERSCAEYFAGRFLACSRFDPLHAADSEQIVYAQLQGWLELLGRSAEAELQFVYKGNAFHATVCRVDLQQRLQRRMQPIIQSLRARLRADRPSALQLDCHVSDYPGLTELLAGLPGCALFVLERGAAATGLAQRHAHLARGAGAPGICATLPWDLPPVELAAGQATDPVADTPSHVVSGSRVWRLDGKVLRIGSEPAPGEYSLLIDARHSGVSRRHCSIDSSGGRVVLHDHSRFGTRLNGHKVQGSAVLQTGDVITLGDPPCELQLVAEERVP